MLSVHEHATIEDASQDLLAFVLEPSNWVLTDRSPKDTSDPVSPGEAYQRNVGKLKVAASVDVQPNLQTHLRIAFKAPGLSPMKAADHLESFMKTRIPLQPNTEWQVEMDGKNWIHFVRAYTTASLKG